MGTGTDVGKTIVTAGLASICTSFGLKTAVMKPIQTGTAANHNDLQRIQELVVGLQELPQSLVSPYIFKFPASPHLAAKLENKIIDPQLIKNSINRLIDSDIDVLLIEGAGGILVPITEDFTFLDFLKEMQIPAIITASTGLGTINHTLMTVNILKQASVPIAGIVFNKMPSNPGIIEKDNLSIIEKFAKVPIVGIIYDLKNSKDNFQVSLCREFNKQEKLKKIICDGKV